VTGGDCRGAGRGGQRQIDPLGVEAGRESAPVEFGLASLEGRFDRLLDGVQQLADARAFFRCELAELLRDLSERALAAEHFDAHLLEILGGGGVGDALSGARLQFG